jgi:hypothetical protein
MQVRGGAATAVDGQDILGELSLFIAHQLPFDNSLDVRKR